MTINIRQTALTRYQEDQEAKRIAQQQAEERELAARKHTYKKALVNIFELSEEEAKEIVYGKEIFNYDTISCFSKEGLTFTISNDGKTGMVFCQTGASYADWLSFSDLTKLGEILENHTEADPKDYTPIGVSGFQTRYVIHEKVDHECQMTGMKPKYEEKS